MAEQKTSRLVPQHQFWEDDLPLREAPTQAATRTPENLTSRDSERLVISRADNLMRGLALLACIAMFVLGAVGVSALVYAVVDQIQRDGGYAGAFATMLVVFSVALLFGLTLFFRLDLHVPRDTPVHFDRKQKLVRAHDYQWSWNPFKHWPHVIKEFSWDNVQAEIQKQAGFNGKAYVVRYALVLCVCKPGTLEVVDRITLLGNQVFPQTFEPAWNYLRRYMAEGPAGLPPVKVRPPEISFTRSFFEYLPSWEPGERGAEIRAQAPGWLLAFDSVVNVLVFPLLAGMGICHYIVMRLAPDPDWSNTPVVRVDAPEPPRPERTAA